MVEHEHGNEVVSFDSEELILVDEHDREIGHLDKAACHQGQALLHRAFSLFVFNDRGELLLQRRAAGKRLWPGFWSNSCCSHPRRGESVELASRRRLHQELGLHAEPEFVYKFQYHAQYDADGAERELCWVLLARSDETPRPNANEIDGWRYISSAALDAELAAWPGRFTPWFKLEWAELQRSHGERLGCYLHPVPDRILQARGAGE